MGADEILATLEGKTRKGPFCGVQSGKIIVCVMYVLMYYTTLRKIEKETATEGEQISNIFSGS